MIGVFAALLISVLGLWLVVRLSEDVRWHEGQWMPLVRCLDCLEAEMDSYFAWVVEKWAVPTPILAALRDRDGAGS